MKAPAKAAVCFVAGFVIAFVLLRIAGERYRHEDDFFLRDTWTGKLYKPQSGRWVSP